MTLLSLLMHAPEMMPNILLSTTSVVQVHRSLRCVCLCVRTITFELNNRWRRHLARWFTLTLGHALWSKSYVKVQVHRRKTRTQQLRRLSTAAEKQTWIGNCKQGTTSRKWSSQIVTMVGKECCWSSRCVTSSEGCLVTISSYREAKKSGPRHKAVASADVRQARSTFFLPLSPR